MFTRPTTKSTLEITLDSELIQLRELNPTSKEYEKTLETVSKLHRMKQDDKPATLSPDTVAVVAANLLGIMLILKYEKFDIVTSKALGFVMKAR